jgi:hypothetical protein
MVGVATGLGESGHGIALKGTERSRNGGLGIGGEDCGLGLGVSGRLIGLFGGVFRLRLFGGYSPLFKIAARRPGWSEFAAGTEWAEWWEA